MRLAILPLSHLPEPKDALRAELNALPFGESERKRLYDIRNEKQLRQTLGARKALLSLLRSEEFGSMQRDNNGKPYFVGTDAPAFNLTHTELLCAAVLAENDAKSVGIDMELVRSMPRREAIARRLFSEEEQAIVRDAKQPDIAFFALWTRKEASVKCTGYGLSSLFTHSSQGLLLRTFLLEYAKRRFMLSIATPNARSSLSIHLPTEDIKIFEYTNDTKEPLPCLILKP